jgi:hypothetical protein
MTAKRTIYQSPLSDAPNVPKGTRGILEDFDRCSDLMFVDFGEPFGVVACYPSEVC